jgi:hypothetical protein
MTKAYDSRGRDKHKGANSHGSHCFCFKETLSTMVDEGVDVGAKPDEANDEL